MLSRNRCKTTPCNNAISMQSTRQLSPAITQYSRINKRPIHHSNKDQLQLRCSVRQADPSLPAKSIGNTLPQKVSSE